MNAQYIVQLEHTTRNRLVTWRVDSLRDSRPLGQLCRVERVSICANTSHSSHNREGDQRLVYGSAEMPPKPRREWRKMVTIAPNATGKEKLQRTVNGLPVSLLFPVEYGVFVLGQHLLLRRHLGLPPLQRL